jgi:hypothetical protein
MVLKNIKSRIITPKKAQKTVKTTKKPGVFLRFFIFDFTYKQGVA